MYVVPAPTPCIPPLFGGYWHVAWRRHLRDNPSHLKVIRHLFMRLAVTRYPVSCRRCLLRQRKDSTGRSWLTENQTSPRTVHVKTRNPVDVANDTGVARLRPCPCSRGDQAGSYQSMYISTDIYSRHTVTSVCRAVEEPWRRQRQRRRRWRRRRHARGRDDGSPRFNRREATRWLWKPKAQASVLPMYDGCPSARIRRQDSIEIARCDCTANRKPIR